MSKSTKPPARKRRKSKQAKLPALPPILSESESREARRRSALEEKASVAVVEKTDDFRGVYEVSSSQWDESYLVEIRDLRHPGFNACSCMDFQMNRLQTCKHIERVFQVITQGKKRAFREAAKEGGTHEEIFVETVTGSPRLRWLRSVSVSPKIRDLLYPFFNEEGVSPGPLHETVPVLREAVASASALLRNRIRFSRHIDFWIEKEAAKANLERLRGQFERDVAAGKRGDNPVNLPLYPYQKEGMKHLAFNGRAMLADEMGLGKTVQAIAAAALLRESGLVQRVLVVSPASLKGEWEDQLELFTGQKGTLLFGPRAERLKVYAQPHTWLLANYEQVRGDVDDINRLFAPDLVILDEAQRIKNWPTKTAKTIKRLRSPYAFVLTGTPLENRVEELYSLVEFVDPLVFGELDRFHREFMAWDDERKRMVPKDVPGLHRRVTPVMLRRRKKDIEENLPDRTEKTFFVGMTPEQRLRYDDYAYQASLILNRLNVRRLRKEELERLQILLGCMRMLCDTPYILDQTCRDCPKLEELRDILDEVLDDPDTKIILFSEWVKMLDLVKELLEKEGVGYTEHTGSIPQQKRREHIRRFKNDPDCRVFLSSESGGVGLNLQNANVVINMDLPWNPAKLEQRIARAWRKQQTRSVQVINLVTENSLEEAMIGKLAYKTALADSVLDGKAFDTSLDSKAGQDAFLSQVRALLGEPKQKASGGSSARKPSLAGELLVRHPEQIQAIERDKTSGAAVIVARPDGNLRDIETRAGRMQEAPVVAIHTETLLAIRKLQELGLLTLSADFEALHSDKSCPPLQTQAKNKTPPAPPKRFPKEGLAHWQTGEQERKAASALLPLHLWEPAVPHLRHALKTGIESLNLFYTGKPDGIPEHPEPPHRFLITRASEFLNIPDPQEADCATALNLLRDLQAVWRLNG
ncbi:MAG: DEAD/DEAH box helicase [Kiritimatiellae bacterium]|nr:DEAD/DEAH box helicase [Kiritimatiellia bacterium]